MYPRPCDAGFIERSLLSPWQCCNELVESQELIAREPIMTFGVRKCANETQGRVQSFKIGRFRESTLGQVPE